MRKIRLGKTNLYATQVSFGALPIQRVSFDEAKKILRLAYDRGVNFFDTANLYTDSEEKIGYALSDVRDKIIIATKSATTSLDFVKANLENSLSKLKTDYIDIYQLHNPATLPGDDIMEYLEKAKAEGKIRHIGITNHRIVVANEALDTGLFETMQFPFSLLASDKDIELVKRCEKEDVGFIAMKAMSGGLITDPEAAFAYISQFKNVVPIFGVQKESEILDFLGYAENPPEYDDAMRARVEEQRKTLSGDFCRGCGYCQPCPVGIDIWQCARMSLMIGRAPAQPWLTDKWRAEMDKIKDCIHCGQCASRCPYGLDTPALLARELVRYDALYEKLRGNGGK